MTRHEALLINYARDLRSAKDRVERWWADQQAEPAEHGATIPLRERWPDGPGSHPRVLSVIRTYWLRCEALNQQLLLEPAQPPDLSEDEYRLSTESDGDEEIEHGKDYDDEDEVYPHVFILEWLMTPENDDLATFIGTLSYWPVGLDDDDNYT